MNEAGDVPNGVQPTAHGSAPASRKRPLSDGSTAVNNRPQQPDWPWKSSRLPSAADCLWRP